MKKIVIRYLAITIIVVLFGVFIYPTMYKYDKMDQKWPVRINRITGKTEVLNQAGWQALSSNTETTDSIDKGNTPENTLQDKKLPATDLSQITGNLSPEYDNLTNKYSLAGQIYNGTDVDISDIVIEVVVMKSDGSVDFTKKFRSTGAHPLSFGFPSLQTTEYVKIDLDFKIDSSTKWSWSVVEATKASQ